jgi:ribonuclease HI
LGASSPDDWLWIVKTLERKIGGWCNIWLSLGGRLTLIKAVLEGLAVFWMTLERIPKKIINVLRRLSSNFLWNGLGKKHSLHLCRWDILTKPRKAGGWGLKSIFSFNTALLASSLWRAVTIDSIWHRIVIDKYIDPLSLCDWFRLPLLQQKRASSFWKGLVAAAPVILHWLRWKPGSCTKIKIGRDKLIGMEGRSILSQALCTKLASSNYIHLAQVGDPCGFPSLPARWKGSTDLALSGEEAIEWGCYTESLNSAGISILAEPDVLVWAGGDASGNISVKNLYLALEKHLNLQSDFSWLFQLWNWKLPLKLKLFMWLAGKGKILTWDALRRRGWEGPGFCSLCRQAQEDVPHILIHCAFTTNVWNRTLSLLKLSFSWKGNTLSDCFNSWLSNKSLPTALAVIVSWHLWIERNNALFEDRTPSTPAVLHRVLASFNWQPSSSKPPIHKAIDLNLPAGHTLVCFDGAALSTGNCCGAGGYFKAHPSRITKWLLNCGPGSNNKAELLGLWTSLWLASMWQIDHLLICGDSRVILDWISQKAKLNAVHIDCWKQRTLFLAKSFSNLSFQHIPRAFNGLADSLSKRSLTTEPGKLTISHCDRGVESDSSILNIF